MRMIECSIAGFGRLCSEHFSFNNGLNSILAKNGQGKSTLAAFICAMLYGLSDTKKQSLEDNDRKKFAPWQGGTFGGSLTILTQRGTYRIERSFGKKASEDTFLLYDAKTGRLSGDFSANIGEELFGIDRDGFLRTVFLSERTLSEKNENRSVSAKLSGTTGISADMGELDTALAVLEEQRRIYSKKGGAGIISDTKSKSAELDIRIEELKKKELLIKEAEDELLRLEGELESAKEQMSRFEGARAELERERRIRTYKDQYDNMRRGFAQDEEKYAALLDFFGGGKPTYEEIDEARMKQLEFERTVGSSSDMPSAKELSELEQLFENGVTEEQTSRVYELALRVEDVGEEVTQSVPESFALRVPSEAELDSQIGALKKARTARRKRTAPLLLLISGTAFGAAAFLSGIKNLSFIPLISVSALLMITALILFLTDNISKRCANAEACASDFIFSLCGTKVTEDALEVLTRMKGELSDYNRLLAAGRTPEQRRRRNEEALREIYDYLAKFPAPTSKTLIGAVLEIKEKQRRLEALRIMSEQWSQSVSEKKRSAAEGMKEAAFFLSRFKTHTERPFDEIRDALTEFNSLSERICAKRKELDDFARMNGIDAISWSESKLNENEIDEGRRAAEEKIFAISKEKILLCRSIESYRLETEELESLRAMRAELDSDEKKYEKNLDIIRKTQGFLCAAHESMTRQYLDKTKAGFKKYVRAIGGHEGEFVLDTDFTLTKYEGASARRTESYSKGTRELYSLALRLALTDALYEDDAPFIILDDPFMSLDDTALEGARTVLKELSRTKQIIYFTCSESRRI